MKRTSKGNIDFAIFLISGALLCFSAYCWTSVLTKGATVLFPAAPALTLTTSPDETTLPETEEQALPQEEMELAKEENIVSVSVEMDSPKTKDEPAKEDLFYKIDDLTAKIPNFWYVNVCRENEWSGIDSAVTYMVTGEISSSQVLLGKEGWLFYKSEFDNDPIGDYDGTKQFTQDEMRMIGQRTLHVQNALEEQGIQFTVLLCPNKENVYAAYMPENYIHAEKSRTDLLAAHLAHEGIAVVNLKEDMIRQSERYPLYYSYDTHWNQLGGYVGTENLLLSWGIDFPSLDEREILSKKLWECDNRECDDDLARLSRLQFVFDDELEHVVIGTFPVDWTDIEKEGYICFENPNAVCQDKILLVGDSFRRAMLPSLCERFREVYVVHRNYFEANMLHEIAPDYVIAEYVERYSGEMKDIERLFL